jgi:tripartite-type tricarboxylate transporter receptor subunit TctC
MKSRRMLVAVLCFVFPALACAQAYPTKPARVVVPFPAGGGVDYMARQMAQKMGENMGQPFIVDNRPGANGLIAAEHVAKSPPDGYTLFVTLDFIITMNPALYARLPYDPAKDFAPISMMRTTSLVILGSSAKIPGGTLKDAAALAKANPSKLSFGSAGVVAQLGGELFKKAAGVDVVHVPFKGSNAVLPALVSGQIELAVDGLSTYLPHIKEGRVRALATVGPKRQAEIPDVPTVREAGFPDAELLSWIGLFAPGATPRPLILRLNGEVVRALNDPQVKQRLVAVAQDPLTTTADELAAIIKADTARWVPLIKAIGMKAD